MPELPDAENATLENLMSRLATAKPYTRIKGSAISDFPPLPTEDEVSAAALPKASKA